MLSYFLKVYFLLHFAWSTLQIIGRLKNLFKIVTDYG